MFTIGAGGLVAVCDTCGLTVRAHRDGQSRCLLPPQWMRQGSPQPAGTLYGVPLVRSTLACPSCQDTAAPAAPRRLDDPADPDASTRAQRSTRCWVFVVDPAAAFICEVVGPITVDEMAAIERDLQTDPPDWLTNCAEHVGEVECVVRYDPGETQEGTGYGDVLHLWPYSYLEPTGAVRLLPPTPIDEDTHEHSA